MENKNLRILMIGAHPDDCEFSTAGVAIKYRQLGHTVMFVSMTNGDAGHHEISGFKLAQIRKNEANQAAAITGIKSKVLDIQDGRLEADLRTREKLISLIREFKPDLIFTHRTNDYHPDHRNTAILVQDSAYAVMVPAICPLSPPLRYQPIVLYMHDYFKKPIEFSPEIVIDIDDVMEEKVAMAHCHKSQMYEWLPWVGGKVGEVPTKENERIKWLHDQMIVRDGKVAERFREKLMKKYGEKKGKNTVCAEAFEISEYGGQLTEESISYYFPF